MRTRRLLVVVAVLAFTVMAGCVGGPGTDAAGVPKNATYDWHTNATTSDVTVNVTQDYSYAVYDVHNESKLTFTKPSELGGNTGVAVGATAFRYPNGTVVHNVTVDQQNTQTVVTLPADTGQFAFTSPSTTRAVTIPIAVNGSHDVALPPGMRADIPILGSVTPGGYEMSVQGDRVHYRWSHVDAATIDIQYYLQRDAYIYGGFLVFLAVLAVVGVLYLRRQVHQLEEARREAGLDTER